MTKVNANNSKRHYTPRLDFGQTPSTPSKPSTPLFHNNNYDAEPPAVRRHNYRHTPYV